MHFKQPGCTYNAWGTFTKNKERTEKLKKTGDSKYIYQSQLGKACFQHDVAHRDFKGLLKITATDKFLRDKAFNISKHPKYDGYQRGLHSMVYKFFDKNTTSLTCRSAAGSAVKDEIMQNKELAEELHKPVIRKLKTKSTIFFYR